MRSIKFRAVAAFVTLAAAGTSASATEYYTYDALGRLTVVNRVGGINDGIKSTYTYDAADNRVTMVVDTTSGSSLVSGSNSTSSVTGRAQAAPQHRKPRPKPPKT